MSIIVMDCTNDSFECRSDHFGSDSRLAVSHDDASIKASLISLANQRIVAQCAVAQFCSWLIALEEALGL